MTDKEDNRAAAQNPQQPNSHRDQGGDGWATDRNGGLPSRSRQIIKFAILIVIVVIPAIVFFVEGGSCPGVVYSYLLPCVALGIILLVTGTQYFYMSTKEQHQNIQLLILVITIASFYAFGWPKAIEVAELSSKFAELCVILTLFLLAELAVILTITNAKTQQQLDNTAENVIQSLELTKNEVVGGIKKEIQVVDKVRDELSKLGKNLQPERLEKAVKDFGKISRIFESAKSVDDNPAVKDAILSNMSEYTKAWSSYLATIIQTDSDVRVDCCLSLFRTYIEEELVDLCWDKKVGTRTQDEFVLATNDKLYLKVLGNILKCLERASEGRVFVWAITNVLPEYWYRWGKQYGRTGRFPVMDDFRHEIRRFIGNHGDDRHVYQRLFLFDCESTTSQRTPAISSRLPIWSEMATMDDMMLLLTAKSESGEYVEAAYTKSKWATVLNINEEIVDGFAQGGHQVYGIVGKEDLAQYGLTYDTATKGGGKPKPYWIKPVNLLDHFEKTYHTSNGMWFFPVEQDADLPSKNPDWLILGTFTATNDYQPIMAIGADLALGSKTMLMHILTEEQEINKFKRFWETEKATKSLSLKEIREIIAEEGKTSETDETGAGGTTGQ